MKKLLVSSALFFTLLMTSTVFAQEPVQAQPQNNQAVSQPVNYNGNGNSQACPQDHPCADMPTNDCWCLWVRYKPCYYQTKRCIEEQIPCKRRCCRYVDRYYQVERCRYVPEKYCETVCRKEPEYYDVDECKTCKRWVCDQQCRYVPEYYWKHTCGDNGCQKPCPPQCPQPR